MKGKIEMKVIKKRKMICVIGFPLILPPPPPGKRSFPLTKQMSKFLFPNKPDVQVPFFL